MASSRTEDVRKNSAASRRKASAEKLSASTTLRNPKEEVVSASTTVREPPLVQHADLGPTRQGPDGAIDGPFGVGIDVEGTIRDIRGDVTYEHHIASSPEGPYAPLPTLMRLLLPLAIDAYQKTLPRPDQGWATIKHDVESARR